MTAAQVQSEALSRARGGQSVSNFPAIIQGFLNKGIELEEIKPRVNIFTFHAWKALGRSVRRGEHGVKVFTWIGIKGQKAEDAPEGEQPKGGKMCRRVTVFHVSQTEERG